VSSIVLDPEAPTRPHLPIDPRIRQRRAEVRRQEGRHRLRILLTVTVAITVVAAALGVLHTPLFKVRHLRLSGADPALPAATLLRAAGLQGQVLMVDVSSKADAARLERLPTVATATVVRQWPGTVRVSVTARTGVAVIGSGSTRSLLDRTGRVLAAGVTSGTGLPVLEAPVPVPAVGGWLHGGAGPGAAALAATEPGRSAPAATPANALAAELALAAALGPATAPRVQAIAVTPQVGLVATVGPLTAIFGDTSDMAAKVAGLAAVLAHGALAGVTLIDLRVPDRPALLGTAGSGGSSSAG
jgi:hypothetical protein